MGTSLALKDGIMLHLCCLGGTCAEQFVTPLGCACDRHTASDEDAALTMRGVGEGRTGLFVLKVAVM